MKEYKLTNGSVLTDDEIEKECAEYEAGTWEGKLTKLRVGRPPLEKQGSTPISFKCGNRDALVIEKAAKISGVNRSSFIRTAAIEKAEKLLQEA